MIATGSGTKEPGRLSATAERFCRRFPLAEIRLATQTFNEANLIGIGGFGKVYRGQIDDGKEIVAMKRLAPNSKQGEGEFVTEIETLSKLRHVNLVSLIGYCDENGEMILVYEYIPRGTLADHRSSLTWKQRLQICIGAGQGLDYLHTGCSIIHRDVKSTNILLGENLIAKVSDFGLAKHLSSSDSKSHVSTLVKGSFGYLDPSYFTTGRLTRNTDTYAFGVVLLEVLSGRPAVDHGLADHGGSLVIWALEKIRKGKVEQIIASNLRDEISAYCLRMFVGVAKRCLHRDPHKRPRMAEAVMDLQLASAQQEKKAPTHKAFRFFFGAKPSASRHATGSIENDHELSTAIPVTQEEIVKEELTLNILMLAVPAIAIDESEDQLTVAPIAVPAILIDRLVEKPCLPFLNIAKPSGSTQKDHVPTTIPATQEEAVKDELSIAVPAIAIRELKDITNNFNDECLIHKQYGLRVYRGVLKSGHVAAIKMLYHSNFSLANKEFQEEVSMVSNLKHENVAQLLGYCVDGDRKFLACEFAPNGSLHDILHGQDEYGSSWPVWVLSWGQRVKIAMGVAKGLEYVNKKGRIHFNIKSSNILLFDDYQVAKITDFRQLAQSSSDIKAPSCDYYLPDFRYSNGISRIDVYSYGLILLELLTGRKPVEQEYLETWAESNLSEGKVMEVVDAKLNGDYPPKAVAQMAKIATACVQVCSKLRPEMSEVVSDLYLVLNDGETSNI